MHLAGHGRELRRKQPGERGLAVSIAAQQGDAVIGVDAQVKPLQHRLIGCIADRRHVERDQRRLQFAWRREVEAQAGIVGERRDRLHFCQHLGARLGLLGSRGARAVAGDIILQSSALRILGCLGRGELRGAFGALALEVVIAAGVERDLAAIEMKDGVNDIVQKIALMADDNQRAGIILQEILEPQRRFEVEVVRRLVKQQHVGFGEKQRGERDAHLPPARIAVERTGLHLLVESEPEQDSRGPGRRSPCVDRQQPLVKVAQAMGIAAMFGLIHQPRTLGVSGEHGIEWRRGPARRFLRDIAEPRLARHLNGAAVGIELADHHLHQGRLSGAIATDQPDPAARRDRSRRAVEDGTPAKAHDDFIDVEHGRAPSGRLRRSQGRQRRGQQATNLNQPQRLHAAAPLRADDDMVVDGDAHVAARFDQVAGEADVLLAGTWVARRVVVDDDDRRRP